MPSDLFWSLNFLRAAILKCDVCALQCQTPTRSLLLFLSRVETGTTRQTQQISRWRPAGSFNDQNKSCTIYKELSNLSYWATSLTPTLHFLLAPFSARPKYLKTLATQASYLCQQRSAAQVEVCPVFFFFFFVAGGGGNCFNNW